MSRSLTRRERSPVINEIAAQHLVSLALGKACYKFADGTLEMILARCRKKSKAVLAVEVNEKELREQFNSAFDLVLAKISGKKFRIADKFASRNSIPVGQNARRYELEEIPAE